MEVPVKFFRLHRTLDKNFFRPSDQRNQNSLLTHQWIQKLECIPAVLWMLCCLMLVLPSSGSIANCGKSIWRLLRLDRSELVGDEDYPHGFKISHYFRLII
jgi:hypothetical protein